MTTSALLITCVMATHADESESVKYIGSASCATFGCHGNAATRSPDLWKSSFILWSRSDPHSGAFDVLFTPRSTKMVELLTPNSVARALEAREGEAPAEPKLTANTGSAGASPSQFSAFQNPNTSDAEYEAKYWSVLERRCIGCHATPAATGTDLTSTTIRSRAESLREGVSCESCHGAASKWLPEHTTSRWADYSSAEKASRWGLLDTRGLVERADLCVDCHVGPRKSHTGDVYDVTHELIAAGHPRLSFEFSAYLANLPPHWDEAKDKDRHGAATFHFDAWRIGQLQMARKLSSQIEFRNSPKDHNASNVQWPEFANYDCFACHHRLRTDRTSATRGQPQPADWPFSQLQIIVRSADNDSIRQLDQHLADARQKLEFGVGDAAESRYLFFSQLSNKLAASSRPILDARLSRPASVEVLENLLVRITEPGAASWERVTQFQLALSAFVEDCDPGDPGDSKRSGIARHSHQLATYLDGRFGTSRPVSIYDSPQQFDSMDKELLTQLQAISAELKSMR